MKTISCSKDANNIFMENWDQGLIGFLEEFKILLLKRSNKVIGLYPVSLGGASGTVVDAKIICFKSQCFRHCALSQPSFREFTTK